MSIIRVKHNKYYTVINNTIADDDRLSMKAKGIFLYAFSRPNDWEFHVSDLINKCTDGRDSIRSGLKELENLGYLTRIKEREKGKFTYLDWEFHETPQLKEKVPQTEKPSPVKPAPENHPLLSTDIKQSTKEQQTKAVVVFASLQSLEHPDIPEAQKIALSKKYSEQVVNDAILVVTHPDFITEENLAKSLNSACKFGWKLAEKKTPEKTKKEWIKSNRDHADKIEGVNIIYTDRVEFRNGEVIQFFLNPEEFKKIYNKIEGSYRK